MSEVPTPLVHALSALAVECAAAHGLGCPWDLPPEAFLNWLRQRETDDLDPEVAHLIERLTAASDAHAFLTQIWPVVTLPERTHSPQGPSGLSVLLVVRWTDGYLVPLLAEAPASLLPQGAELTEARAVSALHVALTNFASLIANHGLAGLRSEHGVRVGGRDELSMVRDCAVQGATALGADHDDRRCLDALLSLLAMVIDLRLPPAQECRLAARQRAEAAGSVPLGGWDV